MSDNNKEQHFDYLPLTFCEAWKHDYSLSLEATENNLALRVKIKTKPGKKGKLERIPGLERGSPIDNLIWSVLLERKNVDPASDTPHGIKNDSVDCLTLWTDDIEFNILLFGHEQKTSGGGKRKTSTDRKQKINDLRCAYFRNPADGICKEHLLYWERINWRSQTFQPISILEKLVSNELKKEPGGQSNHSFLTKSRFLDIARAKKFLPSFVVWNRYVVKRLTPKRSPGKPDKWRMVTRMTFERTHVVALDPFRRDLQTTCIPTKFLFSSCAQEIKMKPRDALKQIYRAVLDKYDVVAGCGSAMQRNLINLASLLVDRNMKVALVTGEPGTGKEALCKAIYFGNKLSQPEIDAEEAVFVQTTARELQYGETKPEFSFRPGSGASEFRESRISPGKTLRRVLDDERDRMRERAGVTTPRKLKRPVVFIDELNKAKQKFLAAMLRPLEQGDSELGTDGKPKFILAASQHIDDLARTPPQDFWTRISHQLRVTHPLSRVTERDAEKFLKAIFYSTWWDLLRQPLNDFEEPGSKKKRRTRQRTIDSLGQMLLEVLLGKVVGHSFQASPLCSQVRDVFVTTLVPLVTRDTLSVRGARSILEQVFARLSWYVRYQKPYERKDHNETYQSDINREISQLVNSAIQDVLVILNWARATPASMGKRDDP